MGIENQQFDTYEEWVSYRNEWLFVTNRAGELVEPDDRERAICFDSLGRRMSTGRDFVLADKAKTFPVRWLWPDQVGGIALFSIGCRALKYRAEVLSAALGDSIPDDLTQIVDELRQTLALMDRIGSPASADAFHMMAIRACLVDEAALIVGVVKDIIQDVAAWKFSSEAEWVAKLMPKMLALEKRYEEMKASK